MRGRVGRLVVGGAPGDGSVDCSGECAGELLKDASCDRGFGLGRLW